MSEENPSLNTLYPKKIDIPSLLGTSVLTLIIGLVMPVIELKELVFFKSVFSILTGIITLFQEGHILLGIIIILFSIVFPISKLSLLFVIWYKEMSVEKRESYLTRLGVVGKWSMLDVFVVAITIVIAKISKFATAEPRAGIYFFCLSIILAMIATERMEKYIKPAPEATTAKD